MEERSLVSEKKEGTMVETQIYKWGGLCKMRVTWEY